MDQKKLTDEEIKKIVGSVKNPGLRFTLDHYLLDYVKHCLLEENQLSSNIEKLKLAINHTNDLEAKTGIMDVISSLECVQKEYVEYVEDIKILSEGNFPEPRGIGQLIADK